MTKVKIVALPAGKKSMNVIVPKTNLEPEKPEIEGLNVPTRLAKVMFPTLLEIEDPEQAGTLALNPSMTKAQAAIKIPSNVSGLNYMNQLMYGVTGNAEKPGLLNVSNSKKDLRNVVNDIHQSYVNKVNATTDSNEKIYAIDQIKKIYGDAVPLREDGSFGSIGQMMEKVKATGKPPIISDDLAARLGKPASKINWDNPAFKQVRYDPSLYDEDINDNDAENTFNNAVQVYEKDPLFRDDPNNVDIISKIQNAQLKFQDGKNTAVIDQINIGTVRNFMETDAGRLGIGPQSKDDMINRFFINLGKAGSGKERYTVKSFDAHLNELGGNPSIDKVANQLADMAITASRQNWKAHDYWNMYGQKSYYGDDRNAAPLQDIFNAWGGNRGEEDADDIFEQFENQAQDLLGMSAFDRMRYTERDLGSLVDKLNENGIDGKKLLRDLYIKKWAKTGQEGKNKSTAFTDLMGDAAMDFVGYNSVQEQLSRMGKNDVYVNPDLALAEGMFNELGVSPEQRREFFDAYNEIPLTGYDQFQKAYGQALTHKDLPLINYKTNYLGIKGQGGKGAAPNEVNIDASLPLSMNATGNQWVISVIDNLIPNIAGAFDEKGKYSMDNDNIDYREDLKYNQKVYLFDKPLKEVREELDPGHEKDFFGGVELNTDDWDWTNSWGNLTDKTLDGLHIDALNNNAATILAAYRNALHNQEDVGQASKESRATGKITTYPVTLNAEDMTGYEIKISGRWLKEKGFQDDIEDKIFSMAIPKAMANNLAYKAIEQKDDMVDRAIIANGSFNIKNPGGNASISRNDKGDYTMTGTFNTYDASSGVLKTTILPKQEFSSLVYKGDKLAEIVKQMLVNQQRNIEAIQNSNRANSTNKIFDPEQLLQELLQ